jgi:predicted HicB family RNase H-like nuclease
MATMKYKKYVATIEIDPNEGIIYGRVHGLKDSISFHTNDPARIKDEFHAAVDDYIAFCEDLGEKPEKPFNGSMLVRTTPEVHRQIAMAAIEAGKTQGQLVEDAVVNHLHKKHECKQCQKTTVQDITHLVKTIELFSSQDQQEEFSWHRSEKLHDYGVYKHD